MYVFLFPLIHSVWTESLSMSLVIVLPAQSDIPAELNPMQVVAFLATRAHAQVASGQMKKNIESDPYPVLNAMWMRR